MNLNWRVIVLAFLITLLLAILCNIYLPHAGYIAPVIGGLIAGYIIGGNYTDGIVNGGISAGLAGLIFPYVYGGLYGIPLIESALTGFVIFFIFGIIGGLIGFAIKERTLIKRILFN